MFLRNQRLDDTHGLLLLLALKEQRFGNTFACLVHVLHRDSRGIDVGHIISSFQVSCLFKGSQSRSNTCFDIRNRVVPSCLSCNLQCRTACTHSLLGHLLDSFPYLLYFADTKFCLVEEYEMLVQVGIAIQHEASCLKMRITSGTSCLLHIVLQRIRNVIMHHQSHIALIHTHTKGRCGYDDTNLIGHEGILIGYLVIGIHLSVERQCPISIASEFFCKQPSTFGSRHIDYRWAIALDYQRTQFRILVLIGVGMDDRITQIGSRSCRCKQLQIKVESSFEVITDVLNHLLFGGSCKA